MHGCCSCVFCRHGFAVVVDDCIRRLCLEGGYVSCVWLVEYVAKHRVVGLSVFIYE
jgi:hypothetical protein